MARIDVGKLTEDETRELFISCGMALRDEPLFSALDYILDEDRRRELAERWEVA